MKKIFSVLILVFSALMSEGQEYLPYKVLGDPSGTAPYFFGPSAFPIPDMLKDTQAYPTVELNGDYSWGHIAPTTDRAVTMGFAVRLPLWTDRVNLSVYCQIHEWYWDTPEARAARRVDPKYPLKGNCAGDVYVTADIRVLNERKYIPALTLRAALKTASGDDYEKARFFDAPGYHFDICATKTFAFRTNEFFKSVKASFNFGFLCWQTDIGCQNDAWMVAGSVELDTEYANLSVDCGGYYGREKFYDSPTSVKVKLDIVPGGMITPFVYYQKGIKDWPFDQVKVGVRYSCRWKKSR